MRTYYLVEVVQYWPVDGCFELGGLGRRLHLQVITWCQSLSSQYNYKKEEGKKDAKKEQVGGYSQQQGRTRSY